MSDDRRSGRKVKTMGALLWIVVALLIGGLLVWHAAWRTRQSLPEIELPPGEAMPRAPVQRLAARFLAVIIVLIAAAAALVAYNGPQAWWNEDPLRLTVTALLIAAVVALLLFNLRVKALHERGDGSFDERDGVILGRACGGVGGAMMVVTAVWMIALTEAHRDTHLVPTYYLYLLFWSLVMTHVIASLAGILLAYRRG